MQVIPPNNNLLSCRSKHRVASSRGFAGLFSTVQAGGGKREPDFLAAQEFGVRRSFEILSYLSALESLNLVLQEGWAQ